MTEEATAIPLPPTYERDGSVQASDWQERDRGYKLWVLSLSDTAYMDFPLMVAFETLARCNAACNFCPYPTLERKGDRMPDALIDKIIRELKDIPSDLPFEICPHRVNEPFLDKRVFDYIPRINEELPNAQVTIATNGSVLTSQVLDRIASWKNLNYFNISFNDHREDEYERVMALNFAQTTRNLDHLHERITSGDLTLPARLSRVGDGTQSDHDFIAWCKQRWPNFGAVVGPREDWFGRVTSKTLHFTPQMGCSQWFRMGFLPNGRETYCCFDAEGDHSIGDLNDTHLLEIYNHPQRRARRERGLMRESLELCRGCQVRS